MKIILINLSFIVLFGCVPAQNSTEGGGGDASASTTSAINVNLPSKNTFAGGSVNKLNGYRLVITPTNSSCANATKIDDVNSYDKTALTANVNKGCEYSIGLILGNVVSGKMVEEYYSNLDSSGKGEVVSKSRVDNSLTLAVDIVLLLTEAGKKAGFSTQSVETPKSTSISINPTIGSTGDNTEPNNSGTAAQLDVEAKSIEVTRGGNKSQLMALEIKSISGFPSEIKVGDMLRGINVPLSPDERALVKVYTRKAYDELWDIIAGTQGDVDIDIVFYEKKDGSYLYDSFEKTTGVTINSGIKVNYNRCIIYSGVAESQQQSDDIGGVEIEDCQSVDTKATCEGLKPANTASMVYGVVFAENAICKS